MYHVWYWFEHKLLFQGSYSRLTLRLNLYVGGYDNLVRIKDKVGTSKGFMGCVQQVVVNGYKFDLRKAGLVGDAQFGANVGEYRMHKNNSTKIKAVNCFTFNFVSCMGG